ncbi:MAG TPA: hypothetical protein VME66_16655 [Candidatus Acidoferrales bacterium]|nr:hypothetical protein [Candidatus Acidoferrales bacterium]
MRRVHDWLAFGLAGTMLAGCSGSSPAETPLLPQPQSAYLAGNPQATEARFTIRWPAVRKYARTQFGRRWISPSTASIVVTIGNATKPSAIANAPKANGKSVTTTTTVAAPAGQDTFVFTSYDRKQAPGSEPRGNVVGYATLVQRIIPNQVNNLKVSVGGVVGNVAIVEAPNQPFLKYTPKSGAYDFVTISAAEFVVTAEDADGNAIVPQPADIALAPSVSSTAYLSVKRPDPKKPQLFAVTTGVNIPYGQTAQIVASASDNFGDQAESSAALTVSSALCVAYDAYPKDEAPIVFYSTGSRKIIALPGSPFPGIGRVSALAFDSLDKHVLVGDGAKGTVYAFTPTGERVSAFATIRAPGVRAIVYDPHNQKIYVDGAFGIRAYSADGKQASLPVGAFGHTTSPGPAAYVESNLIAVGEGMGSDVDAYDESGTYQSTSTLPVTGVHAIATDLVSSGSTTPSDVFVAGFHANGKASLFDVTPGQGPLVLAPIGDAEAIAQDPNTQNTYVARGSSDDLLPLTYATQTPGRPIAAASGYSHPVAITVLF